MKFIWKGLILGMLIIGCSSENSRRIQLVAEQATTINLPVSASINNFKFTSDIHIVGKDTFLTFLDNEEQLIYIFQFGKSNLAQIKYEREGPNPIKSEPSLVKVRSAEEIIIVCENHIVLASRNQASVRVSKEFTLSSDTTGLDPGNYYWYDQYVTNEYAYFFEFDFSKARYSDSLIRYTLNTGQRQKIEIPNFYLTTMNDDKSIGRLRTSVMLPQISVVADTAVFSSWYANTVFVGQNQFTLPVLYDHLDIIKSAGTNDKIFQIQSEEGMNGTFIYNPALQLFITERMDRNKETGLFKTSVCFIETNGELLNCSYLEGMLKYATTTHLFYLRVDELKDNAIIDIYKISSSTQG